MIHSGVTSSCWEFPHGAECQDADCHVIPASHKPRGRVALQMVQALLLPLDIIASTYYKKFMIFRWEKDLRLWEKAMACIKLSHIYLSWATLKDNLIWQPSRGEQNDLHYASQSDPVLTTPVTLLLMVSAFCRELGAWDVRVNCPERSCPAYLENMNVSSLSDTVASSHTR